jgi:hypothetical protein
LDEQEVEVAGARLSTVSSWQQRTVDSFGHQNGKRKGSEVRGTIGLLSEEEEIGWLTGWRQIDGMVSVALFTSQREK